MSDKAGSGVSGAKACVFCGASGPLTKEHVYPQWIWREFGSGDRPHPIREEGPSRFIETMHFDAHGGLLGRSDVPVNDRPVLHATALIVRSVCARCNNGWMSQLEGDFAVIVRRILSGKTWRPTPEELRTFRRWGAKTGLMMECVEPAMRLAAPAVYRAVYQDLDLPGTWHFGLARVSHQDAFNAFLCPWGVVIMTEFAQGRTSTSNAGNMEILATEYLIVIERLFLIVRYSPHRFRPPARIDHDLVRHVRGRPKALDESNARVPVRFKELPHMVGLNFDDFFYWGHPIKSNPGWLPYVTDGAIWIEQMKGVGKATHYVPPGVAESLGMSPGTDMEGEIVSTYKAPMSPWDR